MFSELKSLTYMLYSNICQFMIRSPSQPIRLILKLLLDLNYIVKLSYRLLLDISREFVKDTTHFPNNFAADPWIGGYKPRIYDGYTTCSELKQVSSCNDIRVVLSNAMKIPKATARYTPILIISPTKLNLKASIFSQQFLEPFQVVRGTKEELALLNGSSVFIIFGGSEPIQIIYMSSSQKILL